MCRSVSIHNRTYSPQNSIEAVLTEEIKRRDVDHPHKRIEINKLQNSGAEEFTQMKTADADQSQQRMQPFCPKQYRSSFHWGDEEKNADQLQ